MNELPRDLNDILEAFPEFMKDEARDVLVHWDDEGFCGFAQIMAWRIVTRCLWLTALRSSPC